MRGTINLDYHITYIQPIILFNDGQPSKMLEQHLAQYLLYARCPAGYQHIRIWQVQTKCRSEVDFSLRTTISDAGSTSSDMSVV